MIWGEGGKRLPPFLLATWGSRGLGFKNSGNSLEALKL